MGQAVMIKSSRRGITLVLDGGLDFPVLLEEIIQKFKASGKFFSNAQVAISFEGRDLSDAEKYQIVDGIMSQTDVRILCIVDEDEVRDAVLAKKLSEAEGMPLLQHAPGNAPGDMPEGLPYGAGPEGQDPGARRADGTFYRGNLKSGERIETDGSVIVIGDVPKGAGIVSKSDIIVLGALFGEAYAGIDGAGDSFIAALSFAPEKYNIAGIYGKPAEKGGLFRRNKAPSAKIAVAEGGFIILSPLQEGLGKII